MKLSLLVQSSVVLERLAQDNQKNEVAQAALLAVEFSENLIDALAVADFEFVRSLWAERRVGMLLDQIRLHGTDQELVDEVRRLGTRYRIVTPYTSHLIVEEGLRLGMNGARYRGAGDTVPPASFASPARRISSA